MCVREKERERRNIQPRCTCRYYIDRCISAIVALCCLGDDAGASSAHSGVSSQARPSTCVPLRGDGRETESRGEEGEGEGGERETAIQDQGGGTGTGSLILARGEAAYVVHAYLSLLNS